MLGDEEFCTLLPCGQDEGDCDFNFECQDGLVCGSNNCPASLGFDSEVDCCYAAMLGDEDFCATIPCGQNEGDCDYTSECQDGLLCGSNNCPASLGLDSKVDCCSESGCQEIYQIGDFVCNDGNNNENCEWDRGDCCGNNVNTDSCSACECLDPANGSTTSGCEYPKWKDNDFCDTGNNNENCEWDGGDCPIPGDEEFCTFINPCGEDEGDCDYHDECQGNLKCGSNNCPQSLAYDSQVDCCLELNGCGSYQWWGDNYCDDENNKEGCVWDGGDCCGNHVNTQYCSACECLDPNAVESRKKKNLNKIRVKSGNNHLKYSQLNDKPSKRQHPKNGLEMEDMFPRRFFGKTHKIEYEEKIRNFYHFRKFYSDENKFSQTNRRSKYSTPNCRKTSSKPNGVSLLRHSHLASSKYGLTVVLNPNEAEYTDAHKNNYVGFKTLVHTPYNFAEVDAVGMAMDKNIAATVGIRGHHAWITDAANSLGLYQKKCLSRFDDVKKYKEVKLEVFANYTRKGCILECHANIFFDKCGCLPYHYPDFSFVWKKNTTCNHEGLKCISKLVGKTY